MTKKIKWNKNNVISDLKKVIETFKPDIIFSSAISSHIHGEGEYINFEYTYNLIEKVNYEGLIIFGGLQATADPERILRLMPKDQNFKIFPITNPKIESIITLTIKSNSNQTTVPVINTAISIDQ